MFIVKPPAGLVGVDYADFCVADDDFMEPLATAHEYADDALLFVEEHVLGNPAQREYARAKIDSMIYVLQRIRNEHLKED